MKRLVVIVALAFVTLPFFSQAQETTNLGDIVIRFCNGVEDITDIESLSRDLVIDTEAGKQEEICVAIGNGGETPVTVGINFVDGTITNDADQKRACGSEGAKKLFGQYVNAEETSFTLEPDQFATTTATLTFPTGYAGDILGCITAQIESAGETNDGMFEIQTRKASFIEVSVAGEIIVNLEAVPQSESSTITNLSNNPALFVYKDITDDLYKGMMTLSNKSNVTVEATIVPVFSDMMGTTHQLQDQSTLIPAGESRKIMIPLSDNIPFYKGAFTLDTTVSYKAKTEFNNNQDIKTFTLQAKFTLIPWLIVGGIAALVLLIILLASRRKKRKHDIGYDHQQQQQ